MTKVASGTDGNQVGNLVIAGRFQDPETVRGQSRDCPDREITRNTNVKWQKMTICAYYLIGISGTSSGSSLIRTDITVFFSASFLAMAAARDALLWRVDASSSQQSSSNVSIF